MTARPLRPMAAVGAAIVLVLAAAAVLAPVIAPYDPRALSGGALEPPSVRHLLGTNDIGRDIFSELVWGSRTSLVVALGAASLTMIVAMVVGAGSALMGGWAELICKRLIDGFIAVPILPLLLVVGALFGRSRGTTMLAIGLLTWPGMARLLASATVRLRNRGFVRAARGLSGGAPYILRRHITPALGPVVASGFVQVAAVAILLDSGLSFLGVGDPHAVSWGTVLSRALGQPGLYLSSTWAWWVLPAGLAISVAVLGFTFLAVGLDTRFNPRAEERA